MRVGEGVFKNVALQCRMMNTLLNLFNSLYAMQLQLREFLKDSCTENKSYSAILVK